MVAYSHLRRRRSRTGHVPEIPSGVRLLGSLFLSTWCRCRCCNQCRRCCRWGFVGSSGCFGLCPIVHDSPPFGLRSVMYRPGLSTARRSARLRYPEESEVVSAGGAEGCHPNRSDRRRGGGGRQSAASIFVRPRCQTRNGFPVVLLRLTPFAETSVPGRCPRQRPPSRGLLVEDSRARGEGL